MKIFGIVDLFINLLIALIGISGCQNGQLHPVLTVRLVHVKYASLQQVKYISFSNFYSISRLYFLKGVKSVGEFSVLTTLATTLSGSVTRPFV